MVVVFFLINGCLPFLRFLVVFGADWGEEEKRERTIGEENNGSPEGHQVVKCVIKSPTKHADRTKNHPHKLVVVEQTFHLGIVLEGFLLRFNSC